jgi:hypothetical protein
MQWSAVLLQNDVVQWADSQLHPLQPEPSFWTWNAPHSTAPHTVIIWPGSGAAKTCSQFIPPTLQNLRSIDLLNIWFCSQVRRLLENDNVRKGQYWNKYFEEINCYK